MGLVPRPLGRIEKIPVIPRCSAAGSFIGFIFSRISFLSAIELSDQSLLKILLEVA